MDANYTKLPPMSMPKLKKIIVGYFDLQESVNVRRVAQSTGLPYQLISKSHMFLIQIGILISIDKHKKELSDEGKRLARAIKYNIKDDVRRYWYEIIRKNEFLLNLVILLLSNNEMIEDDFIMQVIYRSKDNNRLMDIRVGARTVIDMLIESGVVIRTNNRLRISDDFKKELKDIGSLVFVIMAFQPDMDPIFEGIRTAAKKYGLNAQRVVDVPGDIKITDQIITMIQSARIIIADLTHERPNVYFELGYARGLNKKVITLAKKGTLIHFDVKDWRYIEYTDSRTVEKELIDRLNYELSID